MTVVGVTGAAGFLGWHVRARLLACGVTSLGATRDTFADPKALARFVDRADVIIHVAGVNRASSDDEVLAANLAIVVRLIDALDSAGVAVPVAYTNSTQIDSDTAYGQAKAEVSARLGEWASRTGVAYLDLVLPHLFGEYGRENYNSAVTTFAHALATSTPAELNRSGSLELLHGQDVAERLVGFASRPTSGSERMAGRATSVGAVWDLLERHHARYCDELTVPAFADRFELRMFNTLRSQLFMAGHYPIAITEHSDDRGTFSELGRADGTGQTSISTSHPGVVRGDHFHFDKIERFVVVDGEATIKIRRVLCDEIHTFAVTGDHPLAIDMPPLATHNITNTGDGVLTTVFWAGDHFDQANPDTYADPVEIPA